MAPRNRRLEQARPKKRSESAKAEPKSSFGSKDLPRGTITQNRAKPGRTSQS